MDPVTEIKARLSIEELVGQYCQLTKKGRNFVCLCPFHNDTKPSLLVSPDKGIAYCFPCQKGGDIFSFYQQIEGVDFPEALKDLAEKAGVELPRNREFSKGPKKDEKDRMRECLQEALNFYVAQRKSHEGAQNYLKERKLTPDLIEKFGVGFAPDSFDATYSHLLKQGFSRSEILQAGLAIQKDLGGMSMSGPEGSEQASRMYDRFRNRIMFPIRDHHGNMIGFGGRTLGNDDAKYINSPDGPLYNKSVALFGLSNAKEEIRQKKSVILVEGYFDVIACHRVGIENVVAVSGTALTEQHVTILKRNADRICLLLDADRAGEEAAERAFMLAKKQDLDVRSIILPMGKDPDEAAQHEPEKLQEACASGGVPYLDVVMSTLNERNLDKRTKVQRLLPLLNVIPSAVEKDEALQKAAASLGTTVIALSDDLKRVDEKLVQQETTELNKEVSTPYSASELLLGLLLIYPNHVSLIERTLEPPTEKAKLLHENLTTLSTVHNPNASLLDDLHEDIKEYATVLSLYCEEHFGTWSDDLAQKEIRKLMQKSNRDMLKQKQQMLIDQIREARQSGKDSEEAQLLTQYQHVLKLAQKAL